MNLKEEREYLSPIIEYIRNPVEEIVPVEANETP
jgi:hypothetical protein